MPIYEYRCNKCARKFELLRSFSDADAATSCPSCGQGGATRQLSLVNAFSAGQSLNHDSPSCGSCSSGNCGSCGG